MDQLREKMWEMAAVRWIAEATGVAEGVIYESLFDQVKAMVAGAENALGRVEKPSIPAPQSASEPIETEEQQTYIYAIQGEGGGLG